MARGKLQTKSNDSKARIIIVDDHPIVRQGLAALINHEKDMLVCEQAEDAHQALAAVKTKNPDTIIVDISLKDKSGLELIKDINFQYKNLPILALSMHDESLYAERALRAGAMGYIMKVEATDNVVYAIRKVLSGQIYVSKKITEKMMSKLVGGKPQIGASPTDCLSDRELEVLMLIGQGYGTRKMAEKLYLSVKTIETYRAHIKEKLNLANATELLRYAIQWVNGQEKKPATSKNSVLSADRSPR